MTASPAARVRVYLPSTMRGLAGLAESGVLHTEGLGFAVTDAQCAADPDGELDEWEFLAFLDAAQSSLALLAADSVPRRVVVSVDLDAGSVGGARVAQATAVAVPGEVTLTKVASVHVDAAAAAAPVGQVLAGGPTSVLDDVALEWFAPSELPALLG